MKFRSALLLAALVPAVFALPAHAASSASASLSIAEIVLTDLDVNDGIAPSLQIVPETYWPEAAAVYYTPRAAGSSVVIERDASDDDLAQLDAQLTVGNVLTGSATKRGNSLDSLALATTLSAGASDIKWASSSVQSAVRFVLSPNTRMSITFNLDVQANSVPGESEVARAVAAIFLHPAEATRPLPNDLDERWEYAENALGQATGQAGPASWTGTYTMGQNPFDLRLHLDVSSQISPVPEPHTYGMMMAGLLVAGAAGWRRRSGARKRAA